VEEREVLPFFFFFNLFTTHATHEYKRNLRDFVKFSNEMKRRRKTEAKRRDQR